MTTRVHDVRRVRKMARSAAEEDFALQLEAAAQDGHAMLGGTRWDREYRFHPERRWRFDFACTAHKVAIEIEGGIWAGGRHTRGAGYLADCEKYNAAVLMGWRVLRFPPDMVRDGSALQTMRELLLTKIPTLS